MTQNPALGNRRTVRCEPVRIPALYFISVRSQEYLPCTITGISRNSAMILLPEITVFNENAVCILKLISAKTACRFTIEGRVRLRYRQPGDLAAGIQFGIEFDEPLTEATLAVVKEESPLRGWHSVLQKRIEYGAAGSV